MTSLEMILRVRFVTKQLFCNFFSEHNLTVEWDLICLIRLKNWLHIQVNFLMFILHIISFSFLNHENVKKIHKVNKTYTIDYKQQIFLRYSNKSILWNIGLLFKVFKLNEMRSLHI